MTKQEMIDKINECWEISPEQYKSFQALSYDEVHEIYKLWIEGEA